MRQDLNLKTIEEELIQQQAELVKRVDLLAEEADKSANPDRSDLAQDFNSRVKSNALLERAATHLKQVTEALEKLENDTYGNCDNCGQPIKSGRLEALPHARYCLACKAALESSPNHLAAR